MLPTYRAVLRGDQIEWADDVPEQARGDQAVSVFVTIVGKSALADVERGRRMADALGRLAARGGSQKSAMHQIGNVNNVKTGRCLDGRGSAA